MTTVHKTAVARTKGAISAFDAAMKSFTEANTKLSNLHLRKQKVVGTVAKLEQQAKADPKKYGTALKDMKAKLAGIDEAIGKQTAVVKEKGAALKASRGEVDAAEADALKAAKAEKVKGAVWVDSVEDAASLPEDVQKAVLGGVAYVSRDQALAADVKSVQDATRSLPPHEAIKVLDKKLQGTAPKDQMRLLHAVRNEVEFLAREANGMDVTHNPRADAAGKAYVEMMRVLDPGARAMLAKTAAETFPSGKDWKTGLAHAHQSGLGKALFESMKNGANFDSVTAVVNALVKEGKTDQAGTMRGVMGEAIRELRTDFESKAKVVQQLRGELALLNQGVGSLMTPDQRKDAIAAFKKQHAAEFDAFDSAAKKLTGAFEAFPLAQDKASVDASRWAWNDTKLLTSELSAVQKQMEDIKSSPAGEQMILDALKKQAEGVGPAWLGALVENGKNSKDLAEGTAKFIATGIAQLGMMGKLDQKGLVNALTANASILGIEADAAKGLAVTFAKVQSGALPPDAMKEAFSKIDGGSFGESKLAKTSLKVIGLGFSMYGVAKGIKDWNDASTLDQFKTVVAGANLGVEGASMAMKALGRESAVGALAKLGGGVAVVGGVLDVFGGIKGIANGDVGNGAADLMSGAGGVLMGLAATSSSIPGGQLIGAGLAVAGLVTKLIVGSRAVTKAERAAESDARAYLQGAGINPELAKPLGNVRRADHRNAGIPIGQVAERLGMKPEELFLKLQKLPAAKLDEFVKRMLTLELNDKGRAVEGPVQPSPSEGVDEAVVRTEQFFSSNVNSDTLHEIKYGPRSLSTAVPWAKDFLSKNGVL